MTDHRSPWLLADDRSALLVVDLQERLLPAIPSGDVIVYQTQRLLEAADLLGIPTAATVQYPKGLGQLDETLATWFTEPAAEKLDFSAAVCRQSMDAWASEGRDQIVVVGIETHVCVLQTVLDLLNEDWQVSLVVEAVGARGGQEHECALEQMKSAGATLTTVESVLFQWCRTADRPEFKAISRMVKEG
ncbi:MAG: isochorismatase family protein [Planctomycetota bacterium]